MVGDSLNACERVVFDSDYKVRGSGRHPLQTLMPARIAVFVTKTKKQVVKRRHLMSVKAVYNLRIAGRRGGVVARFNMLITFA